MRKIERLGKKGVSEMVAYVLLVVLAIGLSVVVFAYLKQFIPKFAKPECPTGISLILNDATCSVSPSGVVMNLNMQNKGLFNISAVYVRLGPENRTIKTWINDGEALFPKDLLPGETLNQIYSSIKITDSGNYILEIEPAVLSKKGLALCENAIIKQPLTC